jgi:DNA-binding transcriptional MerR regulator
MRMDGSWTVAELAELAAGALAAGGLPGHGMTRANGRVRDVPNDRLIRWYATVGLVDPPLSRRGRVARYGPRHLLQLVAIKRRQAEGRSLAEIQAELAGATNASLAAVACIPDAVLMTRAGTVAGPARATGPSAGALGAPAPAARSARALGGPDAAAAVAVGASQAPARFWAQRPGPDTASAQARPRDGGGPQAGGPDAGRGAISGGQDRPRLVCGVRLAPGVTVLLDGAEREPGPGDLDLITAAAGPLLQVLASMGLSPLGLSTSPAAAPPGSPPDDPDGQERSRT